MASVCFSFDVETLLKRGTLLTHCINILEDYSIVICWTSPFVIIGVSNLFVTFILFLMENPVSKHCRP